MVRKAKQLNGVVRNVKQRMTLLGVSIPQVAEMLGVAKQTMYNRLHAGDESERFIRELSLALVVPPEALTASTPSLVVVAAQPTHPDWMLIVADEIAAGSTITIDELITKTTGAEEGE